jgi:hypothetical protein
MLNASNSMAAIPNTASATESYSSQCQVCTRMTPPHPVGLCWQATFYPQGAVGPGAPGRTAPNSGRGSAPDFRLWHDPEGTERTN